MKARRIPPLVLALALGAAACERGRPPASRFERMWYQRRADPYAASALFANGMAMRVPPAGTSPRPALDAPPPVAAGDGAALPIAVTRDTLERGRQRFGIYCAACHGPRADGRSPVAEFMRLRPPPSLLGDRARGFSPAQIYTIISEGYGLMPSYADALPSADRWTVVAYLQVLQLRDRVALGELPPEVRQRALAALPPAGGTP